MSRIRWSETLPCKSSLKQGNKFGMSYRVLTAVVIAAFLSTATCWYFSSSIVSFSGWEQRAAFWPDDAQVPRRADVANVIWFVGNPGRQFEVELESLLELTHGRQLSVTIVLGNGAIESGAVGTLRTTSRYASTRVNVVFDEQGAAKKAFGVRQPQEFLLYDPECRFVDYALSTSELAVALDKSNVAPKIEPNSATANHAKFQVGHAWTLQIATP
ncbi:MAG TPA: hypothetical protein PKD54_01545 [Pirellulaceae bacterium]|nr:hypothetical protein [Pirellulaceae bacterium]